MSRSFAAVVVAPLALIGLYLYAFAADQYASQVGFSVRVEGAAAPMEIFGGLADFTGSGPQDGRILEEFLLSQSIVEKIEGAIGLSALFSFPTRDPLLSYDAEGTIEDLHAFWRRMVHVTHDTSAGLLTVHVRAFRATDAQAIAEAVLLESARLVEDLSDIAQADTIAFAEAEMSRAEARLVAARRAMREFRSENQIVDPSIDLQGRMGLLSMLQQQLATALVEADLLRGTTHSGDIRLTQAQSRIAVIEAQIESERRKLGSGSVSDPGKDYAGVVSSFEKLAADRAFAEQSYTLALAAYDAALAEARRKSRYLAVHIPPTLAQSAQYPEKLTLLVLAAAFLTAFWASAALVYYSLRDRR